MRMETSATTPRLTTVETTACTCASPAVMSVPEVAVTLGKSKEYFYVGIREGRFPSVRFGRSRGIPRAFIRAFIAEVIECGLPVSFEDYAASWIKNAQAAA